MPKAYILVGVPGSGKSTWAKTRKFDWSKTVIASTDDYVEEQAKLRGLTYTDVFNEVMPDAVNYMCGVVTDAVDKKLDIVWDQTSTTVHTRAKKLRMIPKSYERIAIVFPTPEQSILMARLNSRPGKSIPDEVIQSMIDKWEDPSLSEGFDYIITIEDQT